MLSFHNNPAVKEKYLNRVIAHRETDKIIQGIGWENGKGCAVGCTLENYDHFRYPIELGLPVWLAKLEDTIFEGLPIAEAVLWPEKFLSAIPIGVDLENIKHKLAILRLDRLIEIQKKLLIQEPSLNEIFIQVISSIEVVKKCHEAEINKSYCDWSAADSAAYSAAAAAYLAARSAAYSAAYSAARSAASSAARSAARSAASSAARSAARSAASSAARSAAYSAWRLAWKQEADDLLTLLRKTN